jgi:hypothetical protein
MKLQQSYTVYQLLNYSNKPHLPINWLSRVFFPKFDTYPGLGNLLFSEKKFAISGNKIDRIYPENKFQFVTPSVVHQFN